ncbi:DUF3231 family protein [Radiobacillus kanasensis]|uniref:DUF3231 family protein n=1 Tax=Radiobacillus kanasensis TaxID=2844358 RepID=UPI001E59F52A|nr:DUF3231 family protein [Radiobacillus kanasensis]UFU00090.1 DUF3231 family protein [Radiobacillus kanasensis]
MNKIKLTANEIGFMWTQYVQNTMSIQILSYFLEKVEDEDIKKVIVHALEMSKYCVRTIKEIFSHEKLPVPEGFSENDVDLNAPKLFSDSLMLMFLENMSKAGLLAHGLSLAGSARKDIRELFTYSLTENMKFFNLSTDTSLAKGLFVRAPQIDIQDEVEYVQGKKYLSPFNKRVLNTIEISHIFENIKTNTVGTQICMGFAQTTDSKEVKAYMKRGQKISQKHIDIFSNMLKESNITAPTGSDIAVSNSNTRVFSDRLVIFLMSVLSATGQGNYSTASTGSMRYDLTLNYQRLSVEIALFAKEGLDIMINHGWLEEPPQAVDHEANTN